MKPAHLCKHFRTKKMYIPAQAHEVFAAAEGRTDADPCGHCWCNRTLSEVGGDDQLAGLEVCNPSRSCFEE
jgi:hypothetical protein